MLTQVTDREGRIRANKFKILFTVILVLSMMSAVGRAVAQAVCSRPGFPPRVPGFNPGSGYVGFLVDKVALEVDYLRILRFPLPIIHSTTIIYHPRLVQ
jgi:hypothetical protein